MHGADRGVQATGPPARETEDRREDDRVYWLLNKIQNLGNFYAYTVPLIGYKQATKK